ncbi:MAG: LD-carboxypeptidase [Candidatus Kapaibacteriales bacterium]
MKEMVRRKFIKSALSVPLLATASKLVPDNNGDSYTDIDTLGNSQPLSPQISSQNSLQKSIVKPNALKEGSRVAFTAPASAASTSMISRGIQTFKSLGCEVVLGDTIKNPNSKYRYLSAPDAQRAEELMSFITDESIDAVIAGRGGYGVMRILDTLDWGQIQSNPKIVMGFSDITALVNPIFSLAGIVAYHGPVGYSSFNSFTTDYVKDLLFENTWEEKTVQFSDTRVIGSSSIAKGRLIGGNLKLITNIMGTPFQPDFTDKILFIEDVDEHPYKIDRMLTQLRLAGVFKKINGVLVGNIGPLDKRFSFKPWSSYTTMEVFEGILGSYDFPTVLGLPFGHTRNNLTMPIGIEVEYDPSKQQLTFTEKTVA